KLRGIGPAQHLARALIASAALAFSAPATGVPVVVPAALAATTAPAAGQDATPAGIVTLDAATLSTAHDHGTVERGAPHTVRPGDTLWAIAQHRYGDPERWRQLWELNHGRTMPDGRPFTDPRDMLPGFVLHMPATSHGDPPAAAGAQHDPQPDQQPGSSPQ